MLAILLALLVGSSLSAQTHVTNSVLVGGQNSIFSLSSDDLILEVTSVSPRLTGRIRSKQAVLDLGSTASVWMRLSMSW
jgi:hypothetical protein